MLTTNVGMEWGLDVKKNDVGDLVMVLKAVKLDDDGTILFEKIISQATIQALVINADTLTTIEKTKIVTALNNFRGNLV